MSGQPDEPVARDAERQLFMEALGRAQAGRPTLLLYDAEPGLGETSLIDQLADSPYLPRRRIRIARVTVPEREALDPAAAVALALASPVRTRLGAWFRRIGPSLGRVVPDWIGALPWGNLVAAVLETTAALRRRKPIRGDEAIAAILAHARARPLAVFVDQLHRADTAAVHRLVGLVGAAETGTRLLVVATANPDAQEAARILDGLRSVQPDRLLRFRMLPDEQSDVNRWLATIGEHAARVLCAAAVAGPEFLGVVVARMVDEDELWTEDRLAECVRAGILVATGDLELEDGDVATAYRFVSEATQVALARGIDGVTRQTLAEGRDVAARTLGLGRHDA